MSPIVVVIARHQVQLNNSGVVFDDTVSAAAAVSIQVKNQDPVGSGQQGFFGRKCESVKRAEPCSGSASGMVQSTG